MSYKALLNTDHKPRNIEICVKVARPNTKVFIRAYDISMQGAVHMDRWQIIEQPNVPHLFEIRIPKSPKELVLEVKTEDNSAFKVTRPKVKKLKQYMPCLSGKGNSKKIAEFLKFAQEFSERAAINDARTYYSDNMNFRIDYKDQITDDESGQVLPTPARIHKGNGRMEVCRKDFINMTIPMRVAVLTHEGSHFYVNEEQDDEIEADLNGLKMYLALGYPTIEATKGFTQVFHRHPTPQNKERYDYILAFVRNFEKNKYRYCLPM